MQQYVLNEGVLNDDALYIADEGKGFGKGRYKYLIEYFTYANEWCDGAQQIVARTLEGALKKYHKLTGRPVEIEFCQSNNSTAWDRLDDDSLSENRVSGGYRENGKAIQSGWFMDVNK